MSSKEFFSFLRYAPLSELASEAKRLHNEVKAAGRVRTLAVDQKKEQLSLLRQAIRA
jgi:hypothetical protein